MRTENFGHCACGAVRYGVDGPLRSVFNCHCDRCRRTSGHHVAATQCTVDALSIEDGALRWWSAAKGVEYGFCANCGSSLFWRTAADPGHVSIMAGTLDGPTGLRTAAAWFVDDASDYHERAQGLQEHPGDG